MQQKIPGPMIFALFCLTLYYLSLVWGNVRGLGLKSGGMILRMVWAQNDRPSRWKMVLEDDVGSLVRKRINSLSGNRRSRRLHPMRELQLAQTIRVSAPFKMLADCWWFLLHWSVILAEREFLSKRKRFPPFMCLVRPLPCFDINVNISLC